MSKPNSAAAFLENMKQGTAEEDSSSPAPIVTRKAREKSVPGTRRGLKHIGGYLPRETVERVAILRVRLELDNSELIKLAIDELYNKQKAKRAFDD